MTDMGHQRTRRGANVYVPSGSEVDFDHKCNVTADPLVADIVSSIISA
jgi:hypothetical protein